MFRNLLTTTCVLALTLSVGGCNKDTPDGTSNPPSSSGGGNGDGAGSSGGDGGGGSADGGAGDGGSGDGGGGEPDLTQTICEAEVGESPTVYFNETLMLRLPKNVSEDNLVERSPMLARTTSPVESVTCVEGLPGVTINTTMLGYFDDDAEKPMAAWLTDIMTGLGLEEGQYTFSETAEKGRRIETVVEIPGDSPGKGWLVLKAGGGLMYYAYFEVHPNAFNAIRKTFKASTDKMLIIGG